MRPNMITETYDEKNARGVMLHANASSKLFYDAETKVPVYTDELENLFVKGMVVKTSAGDLFKPITLSKGKAIAFKVETTTVTAVNFEATARS